MSVVKVFMCQGYGQYTSRHVFFLPGTLFRIPLYTDLGQPKSVAPPPGCSEPD